MFSKTKIGGIYRITKLNVATGLKQKFIVPYNVWYLCEFPIRCTTWNPWAACFRWRTEFHGAVTKGVWRMWRLANQLARCRVTSISSQAHLCDEKNDARKGLVTFFVKQKGRKKIWDSFMTKNKIASEKYNEVKTFYIRKQCNTLLRHFYSTQKTEQAIRNTGISNLLWRFRPGAGNYSRLRATLRLYLCLTGQISVNKANYKLNKWHSRAGCCPLLI